MRLALFLVLVGAAYFVHAVAPVQDATFSVETEPTDGNANAGTVAFKSRVRNTNVNDIGLGRDGKMYRYRNGYWNRKYDSSSYDRSYYSKDSSYDRSYYSKDSSYDSSYDKSSCSKKDSQGCTLEASVERERSRVADPAGEITSDGASAQFPDGPMLPDGRRPQRPRRFPDVTRGNSERYDDRDDDDLFRDDRQDSNGEPRRRPYRDDDRYDGRYDYDDHDGVDYRDYRRRRVLRNDYDGPRFADQDDEDFSLRRTVNRRHREREPAKGLYPNDSEADEQCHCQFYPPRANGTDTCDFEAADVRQRYVYRGHSMCRALCTVALISNSDQCTPEGTRIAFCWCPILRMRALQFEVPRAFVGSRRFHYRRYRSCYEQCVQEDNDDQDNGQDNGQQPDDQERETGAAFDQKKKK